MEHHIAIEGIQEARRIWDHSNPNEYEYEYEYASRYRKN